MAETKGTIPKRKSAAGSALGAGKKREARPKREVAPVRDAGTKRVSPSPRPEAKSPPSNRKRAVEPARASMAPPPRRSIGQRLLAFRSASSALTSRLRRPAVIVGKVLLAGIIAAAAIASGRLLETHLKSSPAFATQTIEVSGNKHLSPEQIATAAGLALGRNIFEVSPEDAKARLESHPWIAEASVERRLPRTYQITLRERVPSALLVLDGSLYLVAEDATVFKRVGPEDPVDLPVITGIERARFVRDRAFRTSILVEAVALLHDYRSAGLWRRAPIAEVHVEPDEGLSLYVGEDPLLVRLGRGPYRPKFQKLRRIFDGLEGRGAQASYVYLDNVRRPDRATVRLR